MARVRLTTEQLRAHLDEQLGFLQRSCDSFDAGFLGEAKRMATVVRVLLHDTQHSKSLLGQLAQKDGSFWSTVWDNPGNLLATTGLTYTRMSSSGSEFIAILDGGPFGREAAFDEWWNSPVVDTGELRMSRRDIVLVLANKEGGTHVDPKLDEEYQALTTGDALRLTSVSGGESQGPLPNVHLVSMRQIAHELLRSLIPDYRNPGPSPAAGVSIPVEGAAPPKQGETYIEMRMVRSPRTGQVIPRSGGQTPGRNDPCPCGSGRKFKKCCGRPGG